MHQLTGYVDFGNQLEKFHSYLKGPAQNRLFQLKGKHGHITAIRPNRSTNKPGLGSSRTNLAPEILKNRILENNSDSSVEKFKTHQPVILEGDLLDAVNDKVTEELGHIWKSLQIQLKNLHSQSLQASENSSANLVPLRCLLLLANLVHQHDFLPSISNQGTTIYEPETAFQTVHGHFD
ncbi:hypothetical protein PGTUg99_028742 [Puccinia graminis f. sp. tritici]|uniref:Uncharacterized protein n=1 Tax=Puccinia graminis f. sp. tritici TaxID=56615 RepID=A0A5B0RN37_PUCGR|nr:hypothetical protein PGTUg99_028742 [Puccinia graminis f. sp. tritici]